MVSFMPKWLRIIVAIAIFLAASRDPSEDKEQPQKG
jgi:hypothetical protein